MKPFQTDVTILIAEDDSNDQQLIALAFQRCGCTASLQFVPSGEAAIAYMMGEGTFADRSRYGYPSFIMTDLNMPCGDGFSVLQHLKANPAWSVIPTIVLSSSQDPDDIRTSYALGASSFHTKPGSFAELCTLLGIIYQYWQTCSVPAVDLTGRQLRTDCKGRLGARFPQITAPNQARV